MKKLINKIDDIVPEALAGLGAAHPDVVRIDAANSVVLRAGGPRKGKVALLSGGGSGHEPLHGGFVGLGMLDAACAGAVFTSPVPDQMEAATRAVDGGAGVLHRAAGPLRKRTHEHQPRARRVVADPAVRLPSDEGHVGDVVRLSGRERVREHRLGEDVMELKAVLDA